MSNTGATAPLYEELGLTASEYQMILETLGREPTQVELAMYSVMWSEHCGYKHSRSMLGRFPTEGEKVLQGPGENAGVIDVGDGWAVAFKMESHNHPSAVEPFQGAATGVGGIVRDIIAMGARPIALLDSLRFGSLESPRVQHLFEEAVAGIGGYGNCIGVPTVGGELFFDPSYEGNCLVNAMCIGLLRADQLTSAAAAGVGNPVILFGSRTGRDGIGGASVLASQEFKEGDEEKRPSVQVGDPFTEKLLIEASLELLDKELLVALQDLGAAGLTSSAAEMASLGGMGIELDVAAVPLRESGMEPWEVMISESQERMLAVVTPEKVAAVTEVCEKWGLTATQVGVLIEDSEFVINDGSDEVGRIPVLSLTDDCPKYQPESKKPDYIEASVPSVATVFSSDSVEDELLDLLGSPNIASKRSVWDQYDHMVMTNTTVLPGHDAAVIRLKGTDRGLAMTSDCNSRYVYLDPLKGGMIAVAEAARNVSATGATPAAITDCLNFGNPEKPEIYWQFKNAIEGISQACEAFGVPVVSGNVSFYNESNGAAIYPTPTIGMVGTLDDVTKTCESGFRSDGDRIFLVGDTLSELGGSEYASHVHNIVEGPIPSLDLGVAKATCDMVRSAVSSGVLKSAHDLSEGGLAIAVAESCVNGAIGAKIDLSSSGQELSIVESLFSETQSRFLVSTSQSDGDGFLKLAEEFGIRVAEIGEVGGDAMQIGSAVELPLDVVCNTYQQGIQKWIQKT